jgi:ubiquinone/menaquinone biosynthesis C-methylase UbiE
MVVEARAGLRALPDFHVVVAELSQLPFPEGSFDAVIANHMLFHVPNLEVGWRRSTASSAGAAS